MKYINVIFVLSIVFFALSCNNSDPLEEEEDFMNTKLECVCETFFNPDNGSDVIYVRSCVDSGVRDYNVTMKKVNIPVLKSRSGESGEKAWIKWGKVCGSVSGVRFAKEMEKKYKGKCYEMKADVPDTEDCRMMHHRPC